ncbi:MAG: hypothetical protein JXA83_01615, partial [Acidimicrobiales bacterium]|nr:hypothetical protein [Acidimicrobiales bacterium]
VLDAALAAGQLPGVAVSDRLAIIGYSQGGHAALWAGQLAAEWTPDLDVVGTVSGAPVTELPVVLSSADSIPIADYLYLIIAGFEAAYPDEADPTLLLSPDGVAAVDAADAEGCAPRALSSTADMPPAGELVDDPGSVEPWATLLAANDPGRVATDTPILIVHSAADELVPARLSERLFERMCDLGQQVERRVEHRGEGHGTAGDGMYATGFAWIADRFAGEPATSTCPAARGDGEGRPGSP